MKTSNKFYIILSIFASFAIAFAAFDVWLLKGIEKNSGDLISAKNNIAALNTQISGAENFKKNYVDLKPNLDKISQMFVDPENPVDFIKFLEDTAYACQITSKISLADISGSDAKNKQDFIVFQFFSSGYFPEMLNFSKKIEAGPYLVEVENLTIQNAKDAKDGKVDATFTIKAFIK